MSDCRLLNIGTTISLALCVVTVALWAVSLGQGVGVEREVSGRMDLLAAAGGRFIWSASIAPAGTAGAGGANPSVIGYRRYHGGPSEWGLGFQWDHAGLRFFGFALASGDSGWGRWYWIAIPCWFALMLFALAPALRARSIYLARHRAAGDLYCVCGHDRIATSDRCPECGTPTGPASVDAV